VIDISVDALTAQVEVANSVSVDVSVVVSVTVVVSTEITVEVTALAGRREVAVLTAVVVATPVPWPGMTKFLMAT
jgi:hypothetical protein